MKNRKEIVSHILGIIAFLFLPILLFPHPPEAENILFAKPTIRDFVGNALMLGFFYFNYYYLIPKFYLSKKYVVYFLVLIGFLFLICWLPSFVTGRNIFEKNVVPLERHSPISSLLEAKMPPPPMESSFWEEIKHHIFLYGIVILFSILLHTRNRLLKSENDKLQAELSNLKAQIHPHFLFNTLNSIYALAIRKDDKAAETIVKLSEFMRYLLKDSNQNSVSLEKEIAYIENYIDLQKSRLRNSVKLDYQTIGNFNGKQIAPLLLFTYIENAFKHGVNPDEDSVINIVIEIQENHLKLEVKNNIVTENNRESSLEIGLQNTQERLLMLYPDTHKLLISNANGIYTVKLTIDL
jgi:LytS/YehU family sensor histidine kinase